MKIRELEEVVKTSEKCTVSFSQVTKQKSFVLLFPRTSQGIAYAEAGVTAAAAVAPAAGVAVAAAAGVAAAGVVAAGAPHVKAEASALLSWPNKGIALISSNDCWA